MSKAKLFYIGMRINPQFKNPYYKKYGQLSKTEARKKENCVYGSMYLTGYETEEEYNAEINKLTKSGFSVYD